jgi:predicted AlkP superfamily phosphohydrolase/phosphomutase
MMDVSGVVRFYLRRIEPDFELYASPINIDPLSPVSPVSSPDDASAELADAIGIYYTQGMPEDVNALKERALTDAEFMDQSELVHREGVRMLDYALDKYLDRGQGGLLFFYFSGIDLCSHMMWRHFDEAHPIHDREFAAADSSHWSGRAGSTWKDVVHDLYLHMDPVLGHVRERIGDDALLIVMSDHGFAPYRRVFSLNTWLVENGYLVLKPGETKELPRDDPNFKRVYLKSAVDWTKTRAYGMGFNGLYLNLAGRELDDPSTPESEAGIVRAGEEAGALVRELKGKLEALRDREKQVVYRCDVAAEVYHGERASEAPDILVGYNAEYGNSDQSSTGRIPNAVLDDNLGGTFNGNHLMSPEVVKGTLLTNGSVVASSPLLEDLTVEILKQYGIGAEPGMRGAPVLR